MILEKIFLYVIRGISKRFHEKDKIHKMTSHNIKCLKKMIGTENKALAYPF